MYRNPPQTGPACFILHFPDSASAKPQGRERRCPNSLRSRRRRRAARASPTATPPASRYPPTPRHSQHPYWAGLDGALVLRSIDVTSPQSHFRVSLVRGCFVNRDWNAMQKNKQRRVNALSSCSMHACSLVASDCAAWPGICQIVVIAAFAAVRLVVCSNHSVCGGDNKTSVWVWLVPLTYLIAVTSHGRCMDCSALCWCIAKDLI